MKNRLAGLDWASQHHAMCVLDQEGKVRQEFEVNHDAAGLQEMIRRLKAAHVSAVAIERPCGPVVDCLVDAGLQVVPIHPNVIKACRTRYRSHGGRSDPSDAYVIADVLRTDGHRFKPLAPECDQIKALAALVHGRDELVIERVRLANQLRELLQAYWPGAAGLFSDVDSQISLTFIQRYPTPKSASRLGVKTLAAFCKKHHYSGRRSPEDLLLRLRQAVVVPMGTLESEAKAEVALRLVCTLQTLVQQLAAATRRVEQFFITCDDAPIIRSFPSASGVCGAQLLAALGSVRERFASLDHLAAEAGVVPITYASGKTKFVGFRWACNHRLRAAVTCLADASRHVNPWAADIYARARARACDHPHAIRILARAWLRVIWRAWQDHLPYDPQRHGRAAALAIATGG
jgi:transposase